MNQKHVIEFDITITSDKGGKNAKRDVTNFRGRVDLTEDGIAAAMDALMNGTLGNTNALPSETRNMTEEERRMYAEFRGPADDVHE